MRKILFSYLLMFSSFSFSQYWGNNTTSNFTNEAIDVEIDASGNMYVAGYLTGETSFETAIIDPDVPGNSDIYVAKYNPSGSLIWIKQFGGNYSDRPTDLAIGDNNSIYITGQYFGSVTFGSTTLNSSSLSKDIFLIKLNSSGNVDWAVSEGGAGNENAYGITSDNSNNIILCGQFEGSSVIQGNSLASLIDPVTNLPNYDMFISKYDQNGNAQWTRTGIADYEERGLAVSCDSQGNIFMTGQFSDTLILGGITFNNTAYNAGFIAKFNPSGTLQWMNTLKAGMVMPYDLEVNDMDEPIIVGDYIGNLIYQTSGSSNSIINSFSRKIFAMKINNSGVFSWGKSLGSNNDISARSVSIDQFKSIYVTGYFKCDLSELHNPSTAIFNSVGFKDPYLWKIDNLGNSNYVKQFGGQEDDEGHAVAIGNGNQPILCGGYTQHLNFTFDNDQNYSYYSPLGTTHFHLFNYLNAPENTIYLAGDLTRNSFLTNAIHSNTPIYNYFDSISTPIDSLTGYILNDLDTFHFCVYDTIYYDPNTYLNSGPEYNFSWNTGSSLQGISLFSTGAYSVQVNRKDNCSNGIDSIIAIRHELPPIPLLSDDESIATLETVGNWPGYHFCSPHEIGIWFNNLCPDCEINVANVDNGIVSANDILIHAYNTEGLYRVAISDEYCTNYGYFTIELDDSLPYTQFDPYFYFKEDPDDNDTITICAEDKLYIDIYDYYTNPDTLIDDFNLQPFADYNMSTNYNFQDYFYAQDPYHYEYYPSQTGWHVFTHFMALGYDNLCGLDTTEYYTTDSIYIIVNPLPSASTNIFADNLLCPDGSAILYLSNAIPGLQWDGPGVAWVSSDGDSAQVTAAGTYTYSGMLVDTLTGCQKFHLFSHVLQMKQPPTIVMDPLDGIVCPNDSVTLSLPPYYIAYDWIGPDGFSLSTINSLISDDQGFYYCHVTDSSGCILTTAPAEIREFTTPFLFVEPSNYVCPGISTSILVTHSGDAQIQWISPINSTAEEIDVEQPGIYICQIEQCGITIQDSVEIFDGSYEIQLNATDSLLCYHDEAIISTSPGLASYEWNNGMAGSNSIIVETEGNYFVTTTNSFGCTAISDTVIIEVVPNSIPPDVSGSSICPGNSVNLFEANGLNANWFNEDTSFLLTGTSMLIGPLFADTTLLVAFDVPECPPAFTNVLIQIVDSLQSNSILGDSILCLNDISEYALQDSVQDPIWFVNGNNFGSSNVLNFTFSEVGSYDISSIISNSCFTDTVDFYVQVVEPAGISLAFDSVLVCSYDTIQINLEQSMLDVYWTNPNGEVVNSEVLNFSTLNGEGYITVYATDNNFCTTDSDSIFAQVSNLEFEFYQSQLINCFSDSLEIGVYTNSDSLSWSTPIGNFSDTTNFYIEINNLTQGNYVLELWDSIGCYYNDSISIVSNPIPVFDLSSDTIECLNSWIEFNYENDSITYSWQGVGTTNSLPVTVDMWYVLEATSIYGCQFTDSIYIEAIDCSNNLPNVITSNGDGINDYFEIDDALVYQNNRLIILNRWGNVMFQMDGYDNSFNGYGVSDGVYFYIFEYDLSNPDGRKTEGFLHLYH